MSLSGLSGCSFFFDCSHSREHFDLYSDHDPEFVETTAEELENIFHGFSTLFDLPSERIGRTTIFLEGETNDGDVVDLGYTPELLGYYLPIFNVISVDATAVWTREPETLRQILLHEVAHHFIITDYPKASDRCWLNEGLAGNLEMSLYEGKHFEYPLLNPVLLKIGKHALQTFRYEFSLREFIEMTWSDFHKEHRKEIHYALAWSVVNYLLTRHLDQDVPLGERIKSLYTMDVSEIAALEPDWRIYMREFDLTDTLIRLAYSKDHGIRPNLTSRWAIDRLGTVHGLDRARVLAALGSGFECDDANRRRLSYLSFLRTLSTSYRTSYPNLEESRLIREGVHHLRNLLIEPETCAAVRKPLVDEISRSTSEQWLWIPTLVALLESPQGDVRVQAAYGLGQTHIKPTILNPRFWREASPQDRSQEILEWKTWLEENGPFFSSLTVSP